MDAILVIPYKPKFKTSWKKKMKEVIGIEFIIA